MTHSDEFEKAKRDRQMAVDAAIETCRGMSIEPVISSLELQGNEASGWFSSPCPNCGGDDRFNINLDDGGFFCRKGCEAKGSGAIDLVMVVMRMEFMDAVKWLHGDIPDKVDPAEIERRRVQRLESDRAKLAKKNKYRAWARRDAVKIWTRAKTQCTDLVRTYLERRGITRDLLPDLPNSLRFLPDHAYVVSRKVDDKKQLVTMHRGPAMIAAVQGPDKRLQCVHQTWFDLSRPSLKPEIIWNDEKQRNKLTRGSQTRAAIRLITPADFDTMVMAEGIETTLSAAIAWRDELGPSVAYWAGISLPHMAGKMQRGTPRGMPAMDDQDGFVPPDCVKRLIFIQDGDSDATATKNQLLSGLRRAMAFNPNLIGEIVPAPAGLDLNDVLMGVGASV